MLFGFEAHLDGVLVDELSVRVDVQDVFVAQLDAVVPVERRDVVLNPVAHRIPVVLHCIGKQTKF